MRLLENLDKFVFIFAVAILSSCGEGSFDLTDYPEIRSDVNLKGDDQKQIDSFEAKTFFENNLWPLMKEIDGTGCAGSGCHELTEDPNTYFSIDPDSADNSWNWAKVRRFRLTSGDYLDTTSTPAPALIQAQKNLNHGAFTNWSATQKDLIDEWFELD